MFAVLHIPDFPVLAGLSLQPGLRDSPCVVLAARSPHTPREKLPVLAVNPPGRLAGIQSGWPLNRALVRCPDLRIVSRDAGAEAALTAELLFLAESLGPDVEITAADTVTIDLSSRAQAPLLDEARLDGVLFQHARASTPDLACLAARHPGTHGRVIVPADLAPLPLHILDAIAQDGEARKTLDLWGLKTLGDFMKLPRQALSERLGPEAGKWHDLLHAKTCRLLRLHRPPESFAQSFDFEEPVVALDPLVFALKRLLHTLSGRLASRCLAAAALDFGLVLESGAEVVRKVRLPEPQAAAPGMLAPLQTLLDSLRLEAAVTALHLDAETTFATAAQREWFGRQLPEPQRWAETLAKLEAMLGPGRVGIPLPSDSFRPDAFTLRPAVGPGSPASTVQEKTFQEKLSASPACALPLHRFRPPRVIAVAHETRGREPWPLALLSGSHRGEITARRGPFRQSGDWWDPAAAWQRLEWDVQLADRRLLRLVYQPPDKWQLDGIYP